MNKNSVLSSDRFINWIIRYNLYFLILSASLLCFFEVIEPLIKNEPLTDPFHILEVLFFLSLLTLVRIFINHLIRANAFQSRTLEILNFKHDIILELTRSNDSDALNVELAKLPGKITSVEASRLHIMNGISEKLEMAAQWPVENIKFKHDCDIQAILRSKDKPISGLEVISAGQGTPVQEYCIPLRYGNELLGLIHFRLKPGVNLTSDQIDLLENIQTDIALILKVSQEQIALSEMQLAKTALAERRTISTFIHDQLGQNLGYLHLRIDQLVEDENISEIKNVQTELKRLRDVANDSYGIVRDILKTMRSETVPNLTNLLQEQARSVSHRANFALDFKSVGKPTPLLPGIQQAVFFTFCEALSNIEKHANADKVDVLVAWNNGILDISVADNGKGFESGQTQEENHFGLHIMRERISGIQGALTITSATNTGTVISISVPLQTEKVNA